jgi:hypothetical protein
LLNGGNDIDTVPCNDKRETMERRAKERGDGGAEKAVLVSSPPSK